MDWTRHKHDWPHAVHSRFVHSKPHHWHVQEMGDGPLMLLLHGAGGATQSFRHLMPLLAAQYRVIAIDLPGQGFTRLGAQNRCGLVPMAQDIAALCAQEGWHPRTILGHSAGGAIALELIDHLPAPAPRIIGLNAALAGFSGLAGVLFPLMAKGLALMPGVAAFFTAQNANPKSVQRLIAGTGSTLPPEDQRHYRALVGDRGHVNATLQMMAQWDLDPLLKRLPDSGAQGLLITAAKDRAVPPATSARVAERVPGLDHQALPDLGHLAHEEAPERIAQIILDA
ncbi:alpha/beta fold hydrolase [Sulfitobacter albidus]|uniref:Alpha/beta fold hydrolase n=1 Tax=Sulfitobacter albidus TaxID=2829501 RepID=A0A975JH20_9RHOB|nr:alpha/beta fold hydrolase BchO [Sulfitobacter albidus]QUJ78391.1 alpha/beta fold hydrolase [Sulfitobacter albidus]